MNKKNNLTISKLAEATKRQFDKKQISISVITVLKEKKKITKEEENWILGVN